MAEEPPRGSYAIKYVWGVKAVVLGPERSDTEIKDAFEGKYKVLVFAKSVRCQVGFEYRSRI